MSPDAGRRPSVPLMTVLITDGRSQDSEQLPDAAKRLHDVSDSVFVIGVCEYISLWRCRHSRKPPHVQNIIVTLHTASRVNEEELLIIANEKTSNYRALDSFDDLNEDLVDLVSDNLCPEADGFHELMVCCTTQNMSAPDILERNFLNTLQRRMASIVTSTSAASTTEVVAILATTRSARTIAHVRPGKSLLKMADHAVC